MIALKPGTIFGGHFEIIRVISAGGMGAVYEVLHKGTQRRRALKIMLPHVVEDASMRGRFALEAIVTADIESEHLVEVFDAGVDEETESPFIVMELLRGEDLGARLRRRERYTVEETTRYLEQAARALVKTHAKGIVHRDLKPENLFITQRDDGSPRIKILDFGIAKIVKSASTGGAHASTGSFGTPLYMSREQVTGESRLIGPATDVYALGQIAFAMLTGGPYFQDESDSAGNSVLPLLLAVGHGAREPASVRAARRGVILPAAFDDWFARATDIEPKNRFQSATELAAQLAVALKDGVQFDATRVAAAMTPPDTASERLAQEGRDSGKGLSSLEVGHTILQTPSDRASNPSSNADNATGSPQSIPKLPPAGPRSRLPFLAAGAAVAVLGVIGYLAIANRERDPAGKPPPDGVRTIIFVPASSEPAPPSSVVVAPSDTAAPAPPASTAPVASTAPSAEPPRTAAIATTRPSAPPLKTATPTAGPKTKPAYCNSREGFVVDKNGDLVPRPECL